MAVRADDLALPETPPVPPSFFLDIFPIRLSGLSHDAARGGVCPYLPPLSLLSLYRQLFFVQLFSFCISFVRGW